LYFYIGFKHNKRGGNSIKSATFEMAILFVKETDHSAGEPVNYTGRQFEIEMASLEGFSTKSFRISTGFMSGRKFLVGLGKVQLAIDQEVELQANSSQFNRLLVFGKKADAIVNINFF
jgi:hypothetical protein